MKLVEFDLDYPRFADTRAIALNPNHIVSLEPEFISDPRDEYEATIITTSDGRTFQVALPFGEVLGKINNL